MKFRKDINGLRAIAVIAVVLFHFNASWMPGGFAGVDVFFVISGFLMTGIIFRGIEQGNLSILKFYVARANRIIPALALLCFVLLIFGWFYLTPLEYKTLNKHAASSVGFLSNFVYWTEVGYFDAASHEKWLLHTWSLSVEWQFYIIYPLVLVAMSKFMSINTMKLVLVVGTVVGFIYCAFATYRWPNASYYLFPARAWEMMIGGIAYLYPLALQENRKKILEWIGLVLVGGSYFLVSANDPWPGYLAIFPVVGSFLILQAQRDDSFITSNVVSQKLGSWSYSIYLWHWPFVVTIYLFSLPDYYIYLGMVLSVLLGFLSYKYVEKIKFRNNFSSVSNYFTSKPIYMAGFIALSGCTLFIESDAITDYRFSEDEYLMVKQQFHDPKNLVCNRAENQKSLGCIYGSGPVKAIIIGDSHAQTQGFVVGNKASSLTGGSALSIVLSGCPTIKNVYRVYNGVKKEPDYNCGKLVADAIDLAAEEYPNIPVIILNRTSFYIHGYNEKNRQWPSIPTRFVDKVFAERNKDYENNITGHMVDTICDFSKNNPVYLVKPIPEMMRNVPANLLRLSTLDKNNENVKIKYEEYNKRQSVAFQMQDRAVKQCGAKILDPIPYLCDSEYCYSNINNKPLYFDDDHLSSYGSEVISPMYDEVFK